jgi:hypothetical protein
VQTLFPCKWEPGDHMRVYDLRHRSIFDNFGGCDRKIEIVKNPTTIGIGFLFPKFVVDRPLQKLHKVLGLAYSGDSGYRKML